MPRFPDQAETANNRDALVGIGVPRRPDVPQAPPGTGNANGEQIGPQNQGSGGMPNDEGWMQLTRQIKAAGEQYLNALRTIWANNYRAVNNQHLIGSKYATERWRGRSQLHRPKTFTATKKADAGAANALFATSDIVEVTATDTSNPNSKASADINKELLNIRLTNKSSKVGLPWFMVAIGAHNDTKVTGLCVSKQYWERKEKPTKDLDEVPVMHPETNQPQFQPAMDEATGQPQMDEAGQPIMAQLFQAVPRMKVVRDRPMVRLFPPELVIRDPGSNWLNQAQDSAFIGLMHPMTIGEFRALAQDPQQKTKNFLFRNVEDSVLLQARIGGAQTQGVSQAREGQNTTDRQNISTGVNEFERFWAIEWFVNYGGTEYVYWTAGGTALISDVHEVEECYPEQKGERPIVVGLGNLQPHKIDPVSMVQSVLPLQQEMDELVNMRLDGVKESIRPLTFIKRGKNIDGRAIQARSGDTAIYVTEKDDVTFDRPGAIGNEAYMEMNYLNSDYDEAVGQFNGGSVTTNRSLNETVGGMKLLNQSANIVGDFDLRVFIDTWVEPVLSQLVRLEQFYEDDKVILMMAGEKAKLYEKYNISQIDPSLIEQDLAITVNAGIGNADPMVKLDKFIKVAAAAGQLLGPEFMADRAKQDAVIDELFGAAGFREASTRFFHEGDQTDQRIVKLQQVIQQAQAELASKEQDQATKVQVERIQAATQLVLKFLDGVQQQRAAEAQNINQARSLGMQHAFDERKTETLGKQRMDQMTASQKAKAEADAAKGKKPAAAKPEMPVAEPVPPEQAAQAGEVQDQLGVMSQAFIATMLPAIFGQGQMQPPGLPAPQGQAPAPAAQPMPPQQDPMLMQLFQSMMAAQAQSNQAMMALAQAMNKLALAQAMPKTARKNEDGTISVMPTPMQAAEPTAPMTGEQVYG